MKQLRLLVALMCILTAALASAQTVVGSGKAASTSRDRTSAIFSVKAASDGATFTSTWVTSLGLTIAKMRMTDFISLVVTENSATLVGQGTFEDENGRVGGTYIVTFENRVPRGNQHFHISFVSFDGAIFEFDGRVVSGGFVITP